MLEKTFANRINKISDLTIGEIDQVSGGEIKVHAIPITIGGSVSVVGAALAGVGLLIAIKPCACIAHPWIVTEQRYSVEYGHYGKTYPTTTPAAVMGLIMVSIGSVAMLGGVVGGLFAGAFTVGSD